MKKLFVAFALAALVTSPALAASSTSHRQASARAHDPYSARAQSLQSLPSARPIEDGSDRGYYQQNEYWHDRAKGSPG
jgi:hypothetical protein